jgi:hypothetical protein
LQTILLGDTKQHHSVERGDALRVLEESGAVTTAVLSKIIRQKIGPLRDAVQDLSQGRTAEGFDKLNEFGAVHESSDKDKRLAAIAELHLSARSQGQSSLVVAPTHAECHAIADVVRARQKENGSIGAEDHTVTRLAKVNTTEAQRRMRSIILPVKWSNSTRKPRAVLNLGDNGRLPPQILARSL